MRSNLQWLTTYIRPNKGLLVMATILMVAESYASLATIGLQQRLIDDVLIANNYNQLYDVLVLMILAFIAYSFLFTFGPHTIHKTKAALTEHIVHDFMRYMYKIPTASLQKERTGSYVHYVVNDIDKVGGMVANDIPRGLQQLASALVLFGIVGFNSPIILLFSLFSCGVYVWLGRYFSQKLKIGAKQVQETRSDLIVHIEEGISSTREVIAYHRMQWETRIYEKFFKKYFDAVMKEGKLVNLQLISSEPIRWGITVFILGYGGYLVLQGQMSIGVFVILYQFSNQLVSTFQNLFNMAMEFSSKMASLDRVRSVMDGPKWENGTKKISEKIETLQLNNIHFRYDKESNDILRNLSMDIPIGNKVAIVGASGGGKSTIAQLLIRFYDPSKGEIRVNGHFLSDINRKDWSSRVAIVFQEPYLYPDTVQNNILMGKGNVSEDELFRVCQIAAIHDYILSLPDGYQTVIGERGITLSGGQRQRIAIARALIRDPEILILDEATSALDLITEKEIQDNIDQYRRGQSTIIIAHRLSTIKNADCIFVLDHGQLVEQGPHTELLEKGKVYKGLVQSEEQENIEVSV
ncbi:ATP-binding cassette domain-containing protein [Gracilibacillus salitolerans]|uniref:ATP-binding cassette domain-containing protein n=1 Tax=Gracilibacillus salitolerans TaxID=2663022 RepID=A0A5Q2TST6_9BACI|nr:ABC transporter ATP-binding protein [Gracilibacillus salitolerans]QGH36720.1 ATP-binding cassette domain-containing protein [Gracilibacillus salitolerans]